MLYSNLSIAWELTSEVKAKEISIILMASRGGEVCEVRVKDESSSR